MIANALAELVVKVMIMNAKNKRAITHYMAFKT